MATRLKRGKDKEEIYKKLVNEEDSPFLQFSHVFLMAACVGFMHGKKEDLIPGGEQIPWSVFSDDADQAIVNAIAFAETSDLNILLPTEEQTDRKFEIIEKYANAGIRILKEKLLDAPGKSLDNLMDMIFEHKVKAQDGSDRISDFANNLF
ncbi:MAG: DNA phosphorothioation-associated protein 4 [Sulfurovum sp.]|nr:DNA phosphorothioation-associated protein 4 [Sulfurovum sp.]